MPDSGLLRLAASWASCSVTQVVFTVYQPSLLLLLAVVTVTSRGNRISSLGFRFARKTLTLHHPHADLLDVCIRQCFSLNKRNEK